jgi:hypothetical protein
VLGAGLVVLAGLLAVAAALGRHSAKQPVPSFSRLTFRQGFAGMARFAPDGETLIYSAAWEGGPRRLYLKQLDSPEALPLDLPGAFFFALSSRGEIALVKPPDDPLRIGAAGVLARAPLMGGTPREILTLANFPEWTPDGAELAIVHRQGNRQRLEFPPGTVLYETVGNVTTPRFSPDGKLIAFADHPYPVDDRGTIALVDRSGEVKTLTREWPSLRGVAWSPTGDEVWFAASESGFARSLYGVTTSGRLRVLLRAPGDLVLHDVSRAGRTVVAREELRIGMLAGVAGGEKERDLTWLGHGVPTDMSVDGKVVLFTEQADILGPDYAVVLRRTDGSPPTVLGKGQGYALSPDGAWVLASLPSPEAPLELLPVGAGESKRVSLPGLSQRGAAFFPDGRSILVNGYEAGHGPRLYKVSLDGGPPQAVTPEGAFLGAGAIFTISPDGQWAAAVGLAPAPASGFTVWLHPIDKGERRMLAGVVPPAVPLRWSADGAAVLVAEAGPPVRIVRVEVVSGQRSVIKELVPTDALARAGSWAAVTPDGASYVYAYLRRLSELYLVDGLR